MPDAKPKILVLTSTFPRWKQDTEPAFVEYLSARLADQFDVHVLAPHTQGAKFKETWQSLTVFRFLYCWPCWERLTYQGGILANLSKNPLCYLLLIPFFICQFFWLAFLIVRYRYTLIHAHWIIPQGFIAAVTKYLMPHSYKPALICTSHGGDLYALNNTLFLKLKRWVCKQANAVTVVSRAMESTMREKALICECIEICPMGVDVKKTFKPSDKNKDNLIFVGRLVGKKGVRYLVQAMPMVKQRHPDIQLTLIGSGPLEREISGLIETLALDKHIKLLGSLPNHDIVPLLQKAKIAVIPSVLAKSGDQEGLGLVIIEALGCGCAVVASDLPAIRDVVIDGKTGLLSEPENPQSIADKINQLLDDNALANELANNGREFVINQFDWEISAKRYASLISTVLQKNSQRLKNGYT